MKIIDKIVDMVIEGLENGTVAWRKTWKDLVPMNAFSERPYEGLNIFILSFFCSKYQFSYPLFGTYKQINDAGGRIKKGQHSFPVVFWKVTDTKKKQAQVQDEDGNEASTKCKKIFTPFFYNVFNMDQTEGIDIQKYVPDITKKDNSPLEMCENIIHHMPNPPRICHDQPGAFYSPFQDMVNVPEISRFDASEMYYSASFHELAHATGHPNRLNRFEIGSTIFGSNTYSYEELVAEMAATLLCSHCGIEQTVENSVAYLTGWASYLKKERKTTLFGAATKAQIAVRYILGQSIEGEPSEPVDDHQAVTVF